MQIAQIHCTYFMWAEPEAVKLVSLLWLPMKIDGSCLRISMPYTESEYPKDIIPIDQNVFWGENYCLYNEWPFFISTSERKLCPKGIAKVRTWRGHNQKMVGGTRSCTGRAWWTGRGWARAFPGRSYSIWKPWRPWPQEHCSTSQPSTGSTWMYGAEGYWCLGGWERRRSPS